MKPDEDRTPERPHLYCPYCGKLIEDNQDAVQIDRKWYHESCYEIEQANL